ncbi:MULTISPECIES: low specificity L-threonine aldolase [unclassified Haladaptatus]|uniref:threonine aldolase family protein n=1 Tax=unclassified Haladaptatus TaxID=2622732 RepID=UPI00209C1668|nr:MULTISPECIES: low specificity L-threonine aldolase [unclassified Haladaptatus]MCO8242864.1 low specificity L-threonine aldolase [Haladaptatus sp. AB643]MCO8252624.1 low specificity L-threonine aldolase [Haladaptatus sp. AB618]
MIDLRSDTVTKPSEEMRAAAAEAEVGDDVYGEDPTVNELESAAAELVGMEAALYVPTGTMGNQIAARVHTERGQEILVERESHIYKWELGGLAQHSALQVRTLDGGDRGIPTPEQVRDGYVEADAHRPGTGLLSLENTHNSKGGVAIAPEKIDAAAEAAHDLGIPVHLDGARVGNAAVALDVSPARIVENVDSVMFCLSKGLGAPVGSMLAGDEEFIAHARRVRKLLGGGMRQVGIVGGPGLLALGNVSRLADDHENARLLAERLADVDGLSVQPPETNIVLVNTERAGLTAEEFLDLCADEDVIGSAFGPHVVRFCTHWDVDRENVKTAAERIRNAL